MLIGEYQHNIDKKGRVFIPAKLREDLGETFVVSKGLDGSRCLFIYSVDEWKKLDAKIQEFPFLKSRKLQRFLFAGATELGCDTQGRICIPQALREYAGLESGTAIIGASNRVEIWNADKWAEECLANDPDSIAAIMEELNF